MHFLKSASNQQKKKAWKENNEKNKRTDNQPLIHQNEIILKKDFVIQKKTLHLQSQTGSRYGSSVGRAMD